MYFQTLARELTEGLLRVTCYPEQVLFIKKKKVINVFIKMPSNKLFSIFHFQSVLLKKKLEEHL